MIELCCHTPVKLKMSRWENMEIDIYKTDFSGEIVFSFRSLLYRIFKTLEAQIIILL